MTVGEKKRGDNDNSIHEKKIKVSTGKCPRERLNERAIQGPRQCRAKEDLNRVSSGSLAGRNKLLHHKKNDS